MVLFTRLCLIVSLIAASVAMAPMRGQMAGLMQIEICSDLGVETVTLDRSGNPVASSHPCLDCLACGLAAPVGAFDGLRFAAVVVPLSCLPLGAVAAKSRPAIHAWARGPPRLV